MTSLLYETVVPKGTSQSQGAGQGAARQQQRSSRVGGLADLVNSATLFGHAYFVARDLRRRLEAMESEIETRTLNGNGVLVVALYERAQRGNAHVATRRILKVFIADSGRDKQATLNRFLSQDRWMQGPRNGYVMDGADYIWVTSSVASASPSAPAFADKPKYIATVIVERGMTLGALCKKFYPDATGAKLWQRVDMVAKANKISNPNLIRVGQKINFPKL